MSSLKKIKLVFCDNSDAIRFFWGKGLPKNTPIITHSPFLCLSKDFNTISYNDRLKGSFPYFGKYIKELCLKINKEIKKDKKLFYFRSSIYFALHFSTNLFARLSVLKDTDLKKNILIINIDTGNRDYNNTINTNFEKVFNKEINYELITYRLSVKKIEKINKNFTSDNSKRNFLDYLKFFFKFKYLNPINFILYFWKHTRFQSPRGNFIYVYDNPLIHDAFKYFALKGYGIKKINDPKILNIDEKKEFKEIKLILNKIDPIIWKFIKKSFCTKLHKGLKEYIFKTLEYYLYQNQIGAKWWEKEFKKVSKKKPIAVLTNTTSDPTGHALYHTCLRNRIPTFKFQHGVSVEFSKINHNREHISEALDTDFLFVYNKNFCDLDKKNKFSIAKKISVGLPSLYWKKPGKLYLFRNTPGFFYIPTFCYSGNEHYIEQQTDDFSALLEIRLLKKVFSKLNHKILYKYYPRVPLYFDEDPVKKEIKKYKNILLYDKNKNLNDMSLNAKVLITSRATSTLSFCIMQEKPVIFIDWHYSKPLRKLALKNIKKYLFYFNAAEKNFEINLKELLNKGPEYIQSLFIKEKAIHRNAAINYIQTGGRGTGKRVFKLIEQYIKE